MRIAVLAVLALVLPIVAHAQQCLHGPNPTPEQAKREKAALAVVRIVNTIQANEQNKSGRFVSQSELGSRADPDLSQSLKTFGATLQRPEVVPGFELRLIVDGSRYLLTLKDTSDPCRFAFVSDDGGVIVRGEAIR